MPHVFRLAYLDLTAPDLDALAGFYTGPLGLSAVEETATSRYLSFGYDHHNLALHAGDAAAVGAIGYQLSRGTPLARMAGILSEAGVAFEERSDSRPGIEKLLRLAPIGGHVVELFEESVPAMPGFGASGIVPLRLGHFAVISPEGDRLVALHRDVLGFWETDWFGEALTFLTCNHEHHVLNIVNVPIPPRLHHLAFQLRDGGHHITAADTLARAETEVLWGPSRHTAGHNVAQYVRDPGGFLLELYSDMDVYLPDLAMMDPRPWHRHLPMRPQVWARGNVANWSTHFEFDLARA